MTQMGQMGIDTEMKRTGRSTLDQVRRGVLWAMVVSLALGGLLGAAMLLGGVGDATAWRVESTLFALALHCGAALCFLRRRSSAAFSLLPVIGLGVCAGNLCVLLIDTWTYQWDWKGWAQTSILVAGSLLQTPTWTLFRKRVLRAVGATSMVVCASAAGITIADIWLDLRFTVISWSFWNKLQSSLWIGSVALAFICAIYAWRAVPRLKWFRFVVTAFILFAAELIILQTILGRWSYPRQPPANQFFSRFMMSFTVLFALALPLYWLILRRTLATTTSRRLQWLTAAFLFLVTISVSVFADEFLYDVSWRLLTSEFLDRLSLVFAILAVCGVLINAILTRLLRPEPTAAGARAVVDLELRCPKCREDLTLPSGASACPYCKTKFEIRVLPIACLRCGYDLGSLREPTCPECGAVY